MATHEFKDGDPVLIAGTYRTNPVEHVVIKGRNTICGTQNAEIIPDDRSPEWLPGVPGDVAVFDAVAMNQYGEVVPPTGHWMRGRHGWWTAGMGANWLADDDVPSDAVLVLKSREREAREAAEVTS